VLQITAGEKIPRYTSLTLAGLGTGAQIGICGERRVLGDAYLEALRALHALLDAEAVALIERGAELDDFQAALTRARRRRRSAMRALEAHVKAHGC
jgi:hypothetical protein